MGIFNKQFSQLENALTQVDAPPADELAARIAALPRPGKLPSPASTWLLFFLVLYGRRQRSMRRRLARCFPDVFSDEELTSGAALPGMPQWRLTLKAGHLIIVAHEVTGEQLAINDRPLGDEHLVLAAFIPTWLRPRSMWDVGGRLLASIGSGSILTAIEELVAARVLVEIDFFGFVWEKDRFPEGHRLAYWVRRMYPAVSRFCRLWAEETNRLWLAAIIGDWPSADELAQSHGDPEVQRVVAEKLEAYQKRRVSIARNNFLLNPDSVADLTALCEEGVEDFPTFAEHAIAALGTDLDLAELLMNTNDPQWDPLLAGDAATHADRHSP